MGALKSFTVREIYLELLQLRMIINCPLKQRQCRLGNGKDFSMINISIIQEWQSGEALDSSIRKL